MKTWIERFEAIAMAVTFAERGEWETAGFFTDGEKTNASEKDYETKREEKSRRPRAYRM